MHPVWGGRASPRDATPPSRASQSHPLVRRPQGRKGAQGRQGAQGQRGHADAGRKELRVTAAGRPQWPADRTSCPTHIARRGSNKRGGAGGIPRRPAASTFLPSKATTPSASQSAPLERHREAAQPVRHVGLSDFLVLVATCCRAVACRGVEPLPTREFGEGT